MGEEILVYSYRITYFGGTAPCYDDGKYTLAICKRDMRRVIGKAMTANPNLEVWIVAINGRKLGSEFDYEQINHIAKIKNVITFGEYFNSKNTRKDCIYEECSKETKYISEDKYFKAKEKNGIHDDENLQDRDWNIYKNKECKSEKYVLFSDEFKFITSEEESDFIKGKIGVDNLAKGVGHKHCSIDEEVNEYLLKIVNESNNHGITKSIQKYQRKKGGCGKDKAI